LIETSSVPTVLVRWYSSLDLYFLVEFLGRTELRVGDVVAGCEERRGPVTRTLKLLEAESGVITVKLDIQMF